MNSSFSFIAKVPFSRKHISWAETILRFIRYHLADVCFSFLHISLSKILLQNKL